MNFDRLLRASQELNPWYTVELSFKNGKISLGICSAVNNFQLAWAGYENTHQEAIKIIKEQLKRDSLPNGRYASNPEFRQMFERTARILEENQ